MGFFTQFHKVGANITTDPQKTKVVKTLSSSRPKPPASTAPLTTDLESLHPSPANRKRKSPSVLSTTSSIGSSNVKLEELSSDSPPKKLKSHPSRLLGNDNGEKEVSDSGHSGSENERKSKPSRRKQVHSDRSQSPRRRRMVNPRSFTDHALDFVHAREIANPSVKHYRAHFPQDESLPMEVSLQYPASPQTEKYSLVTSTDEDDFAPIGDIIRTVEYVALHLLPSEQSKPILDPDDGILRRLNRYCTVKRQRDFMSVLKEYNVLLRGLRKDGLMKRNIKNLAAVPYPLVELILRQCYERTVSGDSEGLKDYRAFSDNVYGELLPPLLHRMFTRTGLQSHHVFVDLGSGVGNAVLQAALDCGCESWGCEVMDIASRLAEMQAKEFKYRTRLWGINTGKVFLEAKSFFESPRIDEALKRADVLLVNNFAFDPTTNEKLIYKFLDLRDGTRIISLKPFVQPNRVINKRNCQDILNNFTSEEFEFYSRDVSWTDNVGKWYITTVDRERIALVPTKLRFVTAQRNTESISIIAYPARILSQNIMDC